MNKHTNVAFLSALLAWGLLSGCGSSGEGAAGGGAGSTTGMDGGEGASVGVSGAAGDTSGSGGAGNASNAGGAGNGSAANGGGTSAGGTRGGPIGSVTPVGTSDPVCANQSVAAAAGILDVFIMLDRSESMNKASAGGTKWEVITAALDTFVKAPESATTNAGISFFGIPSGGGGGSRDSSCTAADYAKPVVPIAQLGGGAANAAKIVTAIDGVNPGTNTPTEPALQGAVNYASTWAKANPTHKVVVVFATDGLPNGCNSTIDGAVKIAQAGVAAKPTVQTYVIGVFGDDDCPGGITKGQACTVVTNTNQIAKGGGTGSAFIVNASEATGAQFLSALNAIRSANQVGCDFKVGAPAAGKAIDFGRATVRYTPGMGGAQVLPWHSTAAQCGSGAGFYYDSDVTPTRVLLCDATCKAVTADPAAKLDVVLACEPPGKPGTGGAGNGNGGSTGTAGGTGVGGASSGTGGASSGTGGTGSCLLAGQSCQSAAECCGGLCTNGVCASNVR